MQINDFFKKYISIDFKRDIELIKDINLHSILVIGAAGTIGSNYLKQILKFKPKKITIVDFNENDLTELTRDLRSSKLLDYNPFYITYPVNLNSKIFDKIFWSNNYDLIANFSAHKHVRSEKDLISIEALIKNNVYGAIKLLGLCNQRPPKFFFSVSTDKASNPVNIMGASKLLMEKIILSQQNKFKITTARFANVAFSNGSLLDGFINRLKKQQPISCPSDIKRFFVTPKQSGEICMLATFLGDSGTIFFPKLNSDDQTYFRDIALDFIKENDLNPIIINSENEAKSFDFKKNKNSYPLYLFKTDTTGEKPFEQFYSETEDYILDDYNSIGYIRTKISEVSFDDIINDFNKIFDNPNSKKPNIILLLKKYLPEFNHKETGKNLDQRM